MKKHLFLILAISLISLSFFAPTKVNAQNEFNPNRIMEDAVLLNTKSMNPQEIQSFLTSHNSFLANYSTESAYGEIKSAAQIIYDAANNNYDCEGVSLSDNPSESERRLKCRVITTVNPQFLLVLLQKEQSLIQNPNPKQKALDEATGYGCPTGGYCNPYWKGFGKQVNSAALQFLAYMQEPNRYNFKVGQTYLAKDKYSMLKPLNTAINDKSYNSIVASPGFTAITIENQATAALYTYTPHIYNGNYNTHRLMNLYFPNSASLEATITFRRSFPNGSILKTADRPEVWLIENGKKRHFANWASFISRFHSEQIVTASDEEINYYPSGPQIKFANYALVKTGNEKMYLLVNKEKRPFESLAVFKKIGFNTEELELATEEELAGYILGTTITAKSKYITGALLEDNKSAEIFYVENDSKYPVDKVLIGTKYVNRTITKVSPKELEAFKLADPILLDDGSLVMTSNYPKIYLLSDGKKRPFVSNEVFKTLGYDEKNVIITSSQFLYNYPMGDNIN